MPREERSGAPELGSFAVRLDFLIRHVHPAGRGPYTHDEISELIKSAGGDLSGSAIGYLRNGKRADPKMSTIAAIAKAYEIDPAYFYSPDPAAALNALEQVFNVPRGWFDAPESEAVETAEQIEWLAGIAAAMRHAGVRKVAMRAEGMSDDALGALLGFAEYVRRTEQLDKPSGEGQSSPGDR